LHFSYLVYNYMLNIITLYYILVYIIYIKCILALKFFKGINVVKNILSKFIIFKAKSMFETNMFKCVLKWILSISSAFSFILITTKIISNFEKEWCTFDKEKWHLKRKTIVHNCFEHKKGLLKHHQFASSFEQWNFISNETLKRKAIENPIYYAPLVNFQRYEITILSAHTLCSFYCVCNQ